MRVSGASTDNGRVPGRAQVWAVGVLVLALAACGGGDETSDNAVDSDSVIDGVEQDGDATAPGTEGDSDAAGSVGGYDLPDDYPLPAPEGGEQLSALFDDASGSSNVVIAYPMESLDGLLQGYDSFFDSVAGETQRVPLTDGLASWHNDEAGYSVIVNAQNADIQVRLQTGI